MLILLSRKRRNIIFDIASLRLIKFTSLPGRLKISNTSTVYPAKKGYPKSCVRYLELTTHKTPCCLPHRYEPDQTCILPTRKEDTSSSINSASSRQTSACYLTGHRWGNRIKRFRRKRKGRTRWKKQIHGGNISIQL